ERSRMTLVAPSASAARPASMTRSKFDPSSSPARAMTARSALDRSVLISIVALPRCPGPQPLREGHLVAASRQDTVVQSVRQGPREMDSHPTERPSLQGQVQVGRWHGARIERRRPIPDPDDDRPAGYASVQVDRPRPAAVAVLDDVADELVDGLDEIRGRRLGGPP